MWLEYSDYKKKKNVSQPWLCVSWSWRATESEIPVRIDETGRQAPKHGLLVFLNPKFVLKFKFEAFGSKQVLYCMMLEVLIWNAYGS